MRGWRAKPATVTRTVWGPHPVQISQPIDALYGLDLGGTDPMRRSEAGSSFTGARANGDLGPLQTFHRVYGFQPAMVRAAGSSLPSAQGSQASSSGLVDLLGATVG